MLPYAVQPYMTVDLTLKHLLYVALMLTGYWIAPRPQLALRV